MIPAVKVRKLGKAPKHKMAAMRNMLTSLVKYERINTTKGKANEFKNLLDKVFHMLYSKSDFHKNQIKLKGLFYCHAAYRKLIDNLKPKLANYRGKEFLIYVNRIRYASCAKMCIVELAQNPKKRLEDKRHKFFIDKYNNSYMHWETNQRKSRLHELLDYHMQISTLLKVTVRKVEDNKLLTKKELLDIYDSAVDSLPDNAISENLLNFMRDKLFYLSEENLPKSKVDFLQIYSDEFANLNFDINETKLALSLNDKIMEDPYKIKEYDKAKYNLYYKEEIKEFNNVFKLTNELMKDSKSGIRRTIRNLTFSEEKKKRLIKQSFIQKSNLPEELLHLKEFKKSKSDIEYQSTYHKAYVSGEESGFSGVEDLENPPIALIKLRNKYMANDKKYKLTRKI